MPLSSADIVVSFFSSHFGKLDVACDLQSFHQVQGLNAVSEVTELPSIKQDSYLLVFTQELHLQWKRTGDGVRDKRQS